MSKKNNISVIHLIFILILPNVLNKTIPRKLISCETENTIVLKSNNFDLKTLKDKFKEKPYKVIANKVVVNYENIENENVSGKIYTLTLTWNHTIIDCSYMFYNLNTVTSIDLSNFNLTNINNTEKMFAECQSIKSITFPKQAVKLSIIDMNHMFYNC